MAQGATGGTAFRRGPVLLIVLCLLAAGLIVALVLVFAVGGSSSSYRTSIESVAPVSEGEAAVVFQVTNQGGTGTPTCDIHLRSENGLYTGSATVTPEQPLSAGDRMTYHATVVVRNARGRYGAQNATAGASSVTCS
jgi:hypothetical protein